MALDSIGIRSRPTWVKGPARIENDEIILDVGRARPYDAFEPEHCETLLSDLAALRDFNLQDPVEFCNRHGLIWQGPEEVRKGRRRESLRQWRAAGLYLSMTMTLALALRTGIRQDTDKPVRDLFWTHRDSELFVGKIPEGKTECLEYASEQLAELVTRGLEGSAPKLMAACSLVKEDGKKVGAAGDFRLGITSANLMAPAYWYLASLIKAQVEFRECIGCGRLFQPKHGSQVHHVKSCATRKRVRQHRGDKPG